MATRRYTPRGRTPSNAHLYAAFIGDLLEGRITATALTETRDGRGRVTAIDYVEPAARVAGLSSNEPMRKASRKKPKGEK